MSKLNDSTQCSKRTRILNIISDGRYKSHRSNVQHLSLTGKRVINQNTGHLKLDGSSSERIIKCKAFTIKNERIFPIYCAQKLLEPGYILNQQRLNDMKEVISKNQSKVNYVSTSISGWDIN